MKINITDHTIENTSEKKLIKDLTILEFKGLIREVISEEIAKYSFVQPLPMQPYYYEPVYPWDDRNKVWCDTKTTMKDISNINYKEK